MKNLNLFIGFLLFNFSYAGDFSSYDFDDEFLSEQHDVFQIPLDCQRSSGNYSSSTQGDKELSAALDALNASDEHNKGAENNFEIVENTHNFSPPSKRRKTEELVYQYLEFQPGVNIISQADPRLEKTMVSQHKSTKKADFNQTIYIAPAPSINIAAKLFATLKNVTLINDGDDKNCPMFKAFICCLVVDHGGSIIDATNGEIEITDQVMLKKCIYLTGKNKQPSTHKINRFFRNYTENYKKIKSEHLSRFSFIVNYLRSIPKNFFL